MKDDQQSHGEHGPSYRVAGSPWGVGYGDRKWLSLRPDEDGKMVRRGFDYQFVPDKAANKATVEITLHHQRAGSRPGTWAEKPFLLHQLKADEAIRLSLGARETLQLFEHLQDLYRIGSQGTRAGDRTYIVAESSTIVATGEAADQLRELISRHGQDGFLTAVSELDSGAGGIVLLALLKRDYDQKAAALQEFEAHLSEGDWHENDWQAFFTRNDWIFGHGLDYRFLVTEVDQPNLGGASVTGKGAQKGDFLLASSGDVRFSVVVEIKTPGTPLLGKTRYRNGAWQIGEELANGTAQLQANCAVWSRTSELPENVEWSDDTGIATVQPKGILIIGTLSQLDNRAKKATFERYRRNTWNPEIITYDELRDRARFLVMRADRDAGGAAGSVEAGEDEPEPTWFDAVPDGGGAPNDGWDEENWFVSGPEPNDLGRGDRASDDDDLPF